MQRTEQAITDLAREIVIANEGGIIISLPRASRITGISEWTLRRALSAGQLRAIRASERGWIRFRCTELARWLETGAAAGGAAR